MVTSFAQNVTMQYNRYCMIENLTPYLYFSALVFFNLFCFIGAIAAFVTIYTLSTTKNRIQKSLDLVDEKIEATTEMTYSFAEAVVSFLMPRPRSVFDSITKLLRK